MKSSEMTTARRTAQRSGYYEITPCHPVGGPTAPLSIAQSGQITSRLDTSRDQLKPSSMIHATNTCQQFQHPRSSTYSTHDAHDESHGDSRDDQAPHYDLNSDYPRRRTATKYISPLQQVKAMQTGPSKMSRISGEFQSHY